MSILIADDDPVTRRLLQATLMRWGYEVLVASNGDIAWELLQQEAPAPELALLDWVMPGKDGLEICNLVRQSPRTAETYLILLTSLDRKEDLATGLDGGADDYISKPFHPKELHARLRTGLRIIQLQRSLSQRAIELQEALSRVHQLQGLLPICSYCKKIREDGNYWQAVENWIANHSQARFSHGVCPDCFDSEVRPELEELGATGISLNGSACSPSQAQKGSSLMFQVRRGSHHGH